MAFTLNNVVSVTATLEENVYNVLCNVTDEHENTFDEMYCSRPNDTFGIGPEIRQWLIDNPDFPVNPHVPPTKEQLREWMPALSARQFRLGLVAGGITPANITDVIEAMPEGQDKENAKIEWEYALTFSRMHPLVVSLSATLGLTADQVDEMWGYAATLK